LLALPAVATLLIINMALGILTRTAPQLNLFGIGFPVTLSMGFLILALSLPGMLQPLQNLINQGINHMQEISATN
jgi:flagellar biosynthetic protein FliR